jgi:hypothetical protein
LSKNSPGLAEKSATAGKKSALSGGEKKIPLPLVEQSAVVSGKIHQGWRKNPPCLAEILALAENYKLCSVRIFLENSAAGRLWSCGTPSLARNYLKSFCSVQNPRRRVVL